MQVKIGLCNLVLTSNLLALYSIVVNSLFVSYLKKASYTIHDKTQIQKVFKPRFGL